MNPWVFKLGQTCWVSALIAFHLSLENMMTPFYLLTSFWAINLATPEADDG